MLRIRWFALPFVVLPLYSVMTSIQACSGGVENTAPDAAVVPTNTCGVDEEEKHVASGDLCCKRTLDSGPRACRGVNDTVPGTPCSALGQTTPGATYTASFDVCVEETCSGDRICSEFPLSIEKTSGTLHCVSQGGQNVWDWMAPPTLHLARRACLVSEYRVCSGPNAGTSNPWPTPYGYSSASFDPEEKACGTGGPPQPYWGPYGYGGYGGYGGSAVYVRSLFLLDSTCSVNGGPPAPCPLDGL